MSDNLKYLQVLTQKKSAVNWFKGLFKKAFLEINDTGEKFTIVHQGDRVEVFEGIHGENPSLIVPLERENIRRLSEAFSDDNIDTQERYRIVKFMLKPFLKAALTLPILQNKSLMKIVKVDTHWQEALLDPEGKNGEIASPYTGGRSIVVLGDSTTKGAEVSDAQKYVNQAEELLRARGIEADLHNLGHAERSIADSLYQAPAINAAYAPEIVVVQANLNAFEKIFRHGGSVYIFSVLAYFIAVHWNKEVEMIDPRNCLPILTICICLLFALLIPLIMDKCVRYIIRKSEIE